METFFNIIEGILFVIILIDILTPNPKWPEPGKPGSMFALRRQIIESKRKLKDSFTRTKNNIV